MCCACGGGIDDGDTDTGTDDNTEDCIDDVYGLSDCLFYAIDRAESYAGDLLTGGESTYQAAH